MKIYFITSETNKAIIRNIKNGIVYSFVPLDGNLEIPICINHNSTVKFINIKSSTNKLTLSQEEKVRKLFWKYFNRCILWVGNKCVDRFTGKSIKKEEALLEGSFILTEMLEVYREYYRFYASFFFLYFFSNCNFKINLYNPVKIRFFSGIVEELELWEAITIHAVAYSMVRDLEREFYKDMNFQTIKHLFLI